MWGELTLGKSVMKMVSRSSLKHHPKTNEDTHKIRYIRMFFNENLCIWNIKTHTTQDETIFNPSAKPSSISKSSKLTYMGLGSCSLAHVQELAGLACTNCTNCTGKRRRRSRSSETMEIFNTWSLKPPLTDLYAEKHHAFSTTQLNTSLQL